MIPQNKKIMEDLISHLKLGKPLLNRRRKPIIARTEVKYRRYLLKFDEWFNKPFTQITQEDVDKFRVKLSNDKIRSDKRDKEGNIKPFMEATKRDIEQKFLKVLLNYVNKPQLALYVTAYKDKTEVPALTKNEVERMVTSLKLRDKLIIQLLFDGGFRAAEFLNVKFKDIKDESLKDQGYYKIRITESKTIPRTIGLTLPLSTEILKEWLKQHKNDLGTSKPLVDIAYNNLNMLVKRAGKNILKKRITPHTLRHSSATYYCHYLTSSQMNKRYGWTMGSDMAQVYIDREGVEDDAINNKVIEEESLQFRKEVNKLQEQLNIKDDKMKEMEKRMAAMLLRLEGVEKVEKAFQMMKARK